MSIRSFLNNARHLENYDVRTPNSIGQDEMSDAGIYHKRIMHEKSRSIIYDNNKPQRGITISECEAVPVSDLVNYGLKYPLFQTKVAGSAAVVYRTKVWFPTDTRNFIQDPETMFGPLSLAEKPTGFTRECFIDPMTYGYDYSLAVNSMVKVIKDDQRSGLFLIVGADVRPGSYLHWLENLSPPPSPTPAPVPQSPSSFTPPPAEGYYPNSASPPQEYPPGHADYFPPRSLWTKSPNNLPDCGKRKTYKKKPPQPVKEYGSFNEITLRQIPCHPAARLSSQPGTPPTLIVLHSTEDGRTAGSTGETEGAAVACAKGFTKLNRAGGTKASAAHYSVDDKVIAQSAPDTVRLIHAPNKGNSRGVGIEHCGSALYCTDEWLDGIGLQQMHISAWLTAELCHRHRIPARYLTPSEVVNGAAGICSHHDISVGDKIEGGHWDPGPNFPYLFYLQLVRKKLATYR